MMTSSSITPVCLPFEHRSATPLIRDAAFDQNTNARTKIQPDASQTGAFPSSSNTGPASSKRYLWSIQFYQQFFDVDTSSVLHRCRSALYPRTNFLDVLEGNPDLYGPFWIATTVVVILFLTGTISQYLAYQGKGHFAYDFSLLSGAAGLVYGYTIFVPLGLWGVLKWSGSESANLLECWALYGYANLIWIVVALVSWSPLTGKSRILSLSLHGRDVLTAYDSSELRVYCSRTRILGCILDEEFVPYRICDRRKKVQGIAHCSPGAACGVCYRHQDLVFCAWQSGVKRWRQTKGRRCSRRCSGADGTHVLQSVGLACVSLHEMI